MEARPLTSPIERLAPGTKRPDSLAAAMPLKRGSEWVPCGPGTDSECVLSRTSFTHICVCSVTSRLSEAHSGSYTLVSSSK